MSGGLLLCSTGFQQQTKKWVFFYKAKKRGLKKRTKEQLATKLPFEE
jgi:hypothetical protein